MKRLKFIILLSILLTIFFIPFKRAAVGNLLLSEFTGIQRGLSSASSKVGSFFSIFREISSLRKLNDELTQKILGLEVDRSKIEELEYENKLLRKEIGYLEKDQANSAIPARIIGREPTNFLDHVIIDKGAKDGVKEGRAVTSGGVFVGQIKDVYDDQSKIVLVTSKDSIILAMIQSSRAKGILRGGISGLILEDITRDAEYKPGDYIITSGLDGQLKEGILIGKAGNTESSSSDLFKSISIEPLADLSKIELVFVSK